MLPLTFQLFELICSELRTQGECVITEEILFPDHGEEDELIESLRKEHGVQSNEEAFHISLRVLKRHFFHKGSQLPFNFDSRTMKFKVTDPSYVQFVSTANSIRRLSAKSREFELEIVKRLSGRITGWLHRVGAPRKKAKTIKEFTRHLRRLGFGNKPLEPKDKDGGLDILWLPPLGTVPLRPIAALQCKNGYFSFDDAGKSVTKATRTLNRHKVLRGQGVFLNFVVFNDYIDKKVSKPSTGYPFIPLGLSDLATLDKRIKIEIL